MQKSAPGGSVASGRLPPAALTSTRGAAPLPNDGIPGSDQRRPLQRVGRLENRLAPRRGDGAHPLLATFLAAADDGDTRPGPGERLRHGAPKRAGAADDDGGFLVEIEEIVVHFSIAS